ncbi:hypothetical protein [Kitasatospora sp. NPDC018619]|uniref:hypothetical protein n=1 Tax=unclassified Kitasatospora TaxID=2633591 RepID=UPI0037BBFD58
MHLVGVLLTAAAAGPTDTRPTAGAVRSALDAVTSARDGVEHLHVHITPRGVRLTFYLADCDLIDAVGRAIAITHRALATAHRAAAGPTALARFTVADFNVLGRPSGPPHDAR